MNSTRNTVKGFFVAMGDDEKNTFEQGKMVNTAGRTGVFHCKETLIATISTNPKLNKNDLHVIEVEVSNEAFCHHNETKFGIKSGDVNVIKIQHFEKAEKEMLAVA